MWRTGEVRIPDKGYAAERRCRNRSSGSLDRDGGELSDSVMRKASGPRRRDRGRCRKDARKCMPSEGLCSLRGGVVFGLLCRQVTDCLIGPPSSVPLGTVWCGVTIVSRRRTRRWPRIKSVERCVDAIGIAAPQRPSRKEAESLRVSRPVTGNPVAGTFDGTRLLQVTGSSDKHALITTRRALSTGTF
jgi:hypothetical protein